jgi:hypothetical protein
VWKPRSGEEQKLDGFLAHAVALRAQYAHCSPGQRVRHQLNYCKDYKVPLLSDSLTRYPLRSTYILPKFGITTAGHAPNKYLVDRIGLFCGWTGIAWTVSLLGVVSAGSFITIKL